VWGKYEKKGRDMGRKRKRKVDGRGEVRKVNKLQNGGKLGQKGVNEL
jgi:hypothetical protein